MISEREIAEFKTLLNTLSSLRDNFSRRKQEIQRLLEDTFALKKQAYTVLSRANRLTRHLTGRQRQIAGLSYHLNEIKARVARVSQNSLVLFREDAKEPVPELRAGFPEDCRNQRELKQKVLVIISLIDRVKKNLLQLELLELRCRELILSINKSMEAFNHESGIIRRKLYPFGFFSVFYRYLRSLWGRSYFSPHELLDISALGTFTGHVLKIADSPVI